MSFKAEKKAVMGTPQEREIHVRLERRKRLQATESKNLPRKISAFDDVSPEVQSQPRDGVTMNGGLGNSFCLSYLRKFSRWITALSVRKFPFLEVSPCYSMTGRAAAPAPLILQ
jgi:hypothetical protein